MLITTKVCFDLQHQHHPATIDAVQNDRNSRGIVMALFSGGISWPIPDGVTAAIGYRKPDKTNGLYDTLPNGKAAVTLSNSTVTAVFAPQMLAAPGVVEAIIVLTDASLNQLATFPFEVNVVANPAAGAVKSEDYYSYTTMEEINKAVDDLFAQVDATTQKQVSKVDDCIEEVQQEKDSFLEEASAALSAVHDAATADAPAIVCDAAGQVITVSDASKRLFQGLKVFGRTEQFTTLGKNLFDISGLGAYGSYSAVEKTGGSVRIYSTAATGTYHGCRTSPMTLKAGTTYAVSLNMDAYVSGSIRFGFRRYENNAFLSGASKSSLTTLGKHSFVFTPSEDVEAYLSILVTWSTEGDMGDATFSEIQIEVGPEATGYEPYTGGMPSPNPDYPQALESVGDGGTVNVPVTNGNFIPYPYAQKDGYSNNGITYTVCEDGSISMSGTAGEGGSFFALMGAITNKTYFPAGKYYFSGMPSGSYGGSLPPAYWVKSVNGVQKGFSVSAPRAVELLGDHYTVSIEVTAGNVLDNVVFKPMLHRGDTELPFALNNNGQSLAVPTEDGLPGIEVTDPALANYTDASGRMWRADEMDLAGGRRIRRVVQLDPANLVYYAPGQVFYFTRTAGKTYLTRNRNTRPRSSHYSYVDGSTTNAGLLAMPDRTIRLNDVLYIKDSRYNGETIEELRTWLRENGTVFYALLETPEESALPEEALAAYAALHTNYPNTTILNDAGAYMELAYIADTKLYVDALASAKADLDPGGVYKFTLGYDAGGLYITTD